MIPPFIPTWLFAIGTRIAHRVTGENFTIVGSPYDMVKGIYFYDLQNDTGTHTLTEPASVVQQNYSVVLPQGKVTVSQSHTYAGSLQQSTDKFDEEASGSWKSASPFGRDSCEHDWARYTGLTNSFDYCKKCNKEKSI